MRSAFVHAGRFTCRLRMMSCRRKRAFSAISSDLLRPRSARVPSGNEEESGFVQRVKREESAFKQPSKRRRREVKTPAVTKKLLYHMSVSSFVHKYAGDDFGLYTNPPVFAS